MQKKSRNLGDFAVNPIGLGCMNYAFGYRTVPEENARKLLLTAVAEGCNFFDTATLYGNGYSEKLLGDTLKAHRNDIRIASKCGLDSDGINGRPEKLIAQCDASLERLQTDVIDLYYLHRADPNVPIAESVGALQTLVDAGKILTIGLSEISSANLEAAVAETRITAVQSEYSLWSRTPEFGILDLCGKNNITFVPFCPLGRGFFAGSAQELSELDDSDLRCTIAQPRFEGENFKANCKLLESFAVHAKEHNCTTGQLALAWLLHQRDHSMIPIPGTTRIEHFRENMAAADVSLDQSSLDTLDELINESTVAGTRYNAKRMAGQDSERDRAVAC